MCIMTKMFLLVAVLLMTSAIGLGRENLAKEAGTEPSMDDNTNNERRQAQILCGRRPAMISKRNVGRFHDDEHSDDLNKILGGTFARQGEVPWQVNLYVNGTHRCGGVVINEFWVLTAARCVRSIYTPNATVIVGDYVMSELDEGQQSFEAGRFELHPNFTKASLDHNIALIKVASTNDARGIQFNDFVQPICLPESGDNFQQGTELTVSGWGRDTPDADNPTNLLKLTVLQVTNHTQCAQVLPSEVVTHQVMCAVSTHGNSQVCVGDFGGPATHQSGDIYILAGTISTVTGCDILKPAIITRILEYRSWIYDTINLYSNGPSESAIPRRT